MLKMKITAILLSILLINAALSDMAWAFCEWDDGAVGIRSGKFSVYKFIAQNTALTEDYLSAYSLITEQKITQENFARVVINEAYYSTPIFTTWLLYKHGNDLSERSIVGFAKTQEHGNNAVDVRYFFSPSHEGHVLYFHKLMILYFSRYTQSLLVPLSSMRTWISQLMNDKQYFLTQPKAIEDLKKEFIHTVPEKEKIHLTYVVGFLMRVSPSSFEESEYNNFPISIDSCAPLSIAADAGAHHPEEWAFTPLPVCKAADYWHEPYFIIISNGDQKSPYQQKEELPSSLHDDECEGTSLRSIVVIFSALFSFFILAPRIRGFMAQVRADPGVY